MGSSGTRSGQAIPFEQHQDAHSVQRLMNNPYQCVEARVSYACQEAVVQA